jgi:RNA polymerase sigma-70 factor (ECF subfamily)
MKSPDPGTSSTEDALRLAMAGYQGGRMETFEQVYAGLAGPLRRYLTAQTRDVSRAEDLLQETFLQIHRSRRTYSPAYPVRPWAMALARHVYLMDVRTSSRRLRHVAGELDDIADPAAPNQENERQSRRERVKQALREVPAKRREALMLHHVAGLSFREIGRRLGIREAAAKLRSSRGMASLGAALGGRKRDKDDTTDER